MGVSDVKYLNPPSPPACHLDFMSLVSRRFISSVHEWTNWCSFILTVKNVEILQNSISWKRHSLFSWCSRIQKWFWQHDCLLPGLKEVILNEVGVCCSRLECNMWALPMIKKQKQKTVIGALQHPKTCVGKKQTHRRHWHIYLSSCEVHTFSSLVSQKYGIYHLGATRFRCCWTSTEQFLVTPASSVPYERFLTYATHPVYTKHNQKTPLYCHNIKHVLPRWTL